MRSNTKKNIARTVEPYWYILPTIILFIFILAIPIFDLIKYSLGDSNIIQGYKGWNSFKNFKYLLNPKFLNSIKITILYVIFGVLGVVVCGTVVSLVLDKPIKGRAIFRSIVIIPWVIPQAFAAAMWGWVVNPQFGFLNQLLNTTGIIQNNISFLSKPEMALATVIVVRVWQGTPFMIISLLAALQTIPEDIHEAASIDGVNGLQRFCYITLPYIRSVLTTTTLIIAAWTMQIFDTVYIMTGGGPARGTQLVAIEIYTKAFQQDDLGTASAIALLVLVVILILSIVNMRKKGEIE